MSWRAAIKARLGAFTLDVQLGGGSGVMALVGPNGSGKSTCLRALVGAINPDVAHIVVGDAVLADTAAGVELPIERRRVGYMPQGYGLFPHLSALDNVAFGLSLGARRQPRADRRSAARRMLTELGGAALAERRVSRLSGGEQQRVALARALVLEPELLLLDEPLAALDATARRAVRRFLAERLAAYGRPTVWVTHDVRDVVALDAEVCVLESGRVVQRGPVEALRAAPATAFVAEFVGQH